MKASVQPSVARRPTWQQLQQAIAGCERCPRLREHCQTVAERRRAAFADQVYWGKPVPNLAPAKPQRARLLIVGLAPAAHGGNRTGRMFTGDRSGDFLFRAMHATGFANQPTSIGREDGLEVIDCVLTATCHCAPPQNKPLPQEVLACRSFLDDTAAALPQIKGLLALGKIAYDASIALLNRAGWAFAAKRLVFAHGALAWTAQGKDGNRKFLLASYHPSQQNTFTGKLTPAMLEAVFARARELIGR